MECADPNYSYHIAFASVFLLVAATSLIQLFICIHAEYARLKTPSFFRACRITNQKFLYILVFFAALLRGLYFAYPVRSGVFIALVIITTCSRYTDLVITGIRGSLVSQSVERVLSSVVDRSLADRLLLGGGESAEISRRMSSDRLHCGAFLSLGIPHA